MLYQICSICGIYADDGGLYEGEFACHDCLDRKNDLKKECKHEKQ